MEKNLDITNPPFNEQIWPVPSDFVKSRFHCTRVFFRWRNSVHWVLLMSMSNYVTFVSVLCFGRLFIFLGVLRKESSSNRRRMLTKWFEGFLLTFWGWKIRVDGRDFVLCCCMYVVVLGSDAFEIFWRKNWLNCIIHDALIASFMPW